VRLAKAHVNAPTREYADRAPVDDEVWSTTQPFREGLQALEAS
jgi:hypothetical protein